MVVAQQANPCQRLFVQLDDSVVEILMTDQLTKTDHRLFWYLFKLERWGDRFVDLPSQSEIALELGVRRETINQSQAKLQNLGLFDFKITGWRAKNLVALRSHVKSEKSHRVLEKSNTELNESNNVLEKTNTELEEFHNGIYIDRACDQTITDLTQTLSEKSESEKNKTVCVLEKPEEAEFQSSASLNTELETRQSNLVISSRNGLAVARRHDPFHYRRIDPKDIQWDWVPDGPWKTEHGKVDIEFQTAIAQRWIKEHGGDLHEKKANVLKHFKNDPANLPIEWEWYQSTILYKAANIQTRKLNGVDTASEEQEILEHKRATVRLPQEMRVTEERSLQGVLQIPHTLAPISQDCHLLMASSAPKDAAAYWENVYARHTIQPSSDAVSDDELFKAKALVESLRQKRERTQSLSPVSQVLAVQPYSAILEDMRKYLKSGNDDYRQIALNWASDPVNGCELVKRNGRVVDIREVEF